MSSPSHEYFRELSALAAIGQLSSPEGQELDRHLRDCADCREAHADYMGVVRHKLPQADAIRSRLRGSWSQSVPSSDLRDRFLARARTEGLQFSAEAERPVEQSNSSLPSKFWRPALGLAAVATLALVGVQANRKHFSPSRPDPAQEVSQRLASENQQLQSQVSALEGQLSQNASRLERLEQDRAFSDELLKGRQQSLAMTRAQAAQLARELQQQQARAAALASENLEKDLRLADLGTKNERLHRDNADRLSERVLLELKVRELNERLEQQSASLERERQLMVVGKDVQQLMGARNLHIIDVHDVDGGGKSAKAFGRVFYAENESLIFYAFDLPSGKLTPAKYTFEAWGQKEYAEHSIRNLGTFEVDDQKQRRWVLKVTDPKLLHDMDSVFVTAETLGDAKEPRGRKLMYAYIVGQANHP